MTDQLRQAAQQQAEPPPEWPLIKNILAVFGLDAIAFVAAWKAAQKAEPVTWMELLREARDNCKASIVEEGISASRKEYRIDLEARLTAAMNTSPPQRQWQGLEAEDLAQIESDEFWQVGNHMAIAVAVEAKLKERNT